MKRVAAIVVVFACALGVAYYAYAPRETPLGQPPLQVLSGQNFDGFRQAFNAASENIRVLLLLSPT